MSFNRIVSIIFPPAALVAVRGKIQGAPEGFKDEMDSSISSVGKDDAENVFEWAKFIYESEVSRKEVIESKAQSYLMGISVSIGILAVIPFLFSSRWSLPSWAGITVAILFVMAIIFMLFAGYYALKTRQGGAMSLPGADLFKKQLEEKSIGFASNSTLLMLYAKNNEKLLIEKSNYLYVAEMCFVRAVGIISVSILLTVGSKFNQSIFNEVETHPVGKDSACESIRKEAEAIKGGVELATSELASKAKEIDELRKKSERLDEQISQIRKSIIDCH